MPLSPALRKKAVLLLAETARVAAEIIVADDKNCGTGAGGFQPGNDCARGDGSGGGSSGPGRGKEPLEGLPQKPMPIPVYGEITPGPFVVAREAAEKYMKKAGLDYDPPTKYAKVDPERAKKVAAEYDKMPHNPNDPEVKAAYNAMIKETLAQYQAIKETGLVIEFNKPGENPYPNPRMATEDVIRNNHLYVFPTNDGFGTSGDFDPAENPLLADSGEKFGDQPALANDIFRAVHDYFGHIKEGVGFRADGEENAWRSHAAMFTPLARRAMTSETRGQNSWLNYGPHGETNRTAKVEDTIFADQKTGIMPEWVSIEGAKYYGGTRIRNERAGRADKIASQAEAGRLRDGRGLGGCRGGLESFGAPVVIDAAGHIYEIPEQSGLGKAFCPTGPGGGIDPTCSPGGSGGSSAPAVETREPKRIPVTDEVVVAGKDIVDSYDIDGIRELMTDEEKEAVEEQIQENIDSTIEVLIDDEMSNYDPEDDLDRSSFDEDNPPSEDDIQDMLSDLETEHRYAVAESIMESYDGTEERRQAYYDFYKENEDRYTNKETKKGVWGLDSEGDRAYVFETKAGNEYQVWAVEGSGGPTARLGEPVTEIGFHDADGHYGITGAGNALEVFRRVTESTTALIQEKEYPIIYFSAAEPSRQKLYDRLVKSIAKDLPQYSAVAGTYPSGIRGYVIAGKDKIADIMDKLSNYDVEPKVLVEGTRAVSKPAKMKWDILEPEKNPAWFEDESEWDDFNEKPGEGKKNCGIGPGGFQPGNDCARGGGGGGAAGNSQRPTSNITREPVAHGKPKSIYFPNVDKTGNNGVTTHCRVGVPAMEIPPPPGVGQLPNLTPHERLVEKSFIEWFEDDPDRASGKFLEMVKASAKPGEALVFGTDDAKALTTAWSIEDQNERAQNRATLNTPLHQTANAIAKRAFVSHLDTLKPGDEILVTVGGCGAGKGYALKNVPQALEMKAKSQVVWDSAGDQNATENPWILKEAEARGLKVNYVYVHADPKTQWADPERGVMKRASDPKDGRMVDAFVFADSYAIGARNHQAFYEENKDNPNASFVFLENTGKPKLLDGIPPESLKVDRVELATFALQAAMKADIPPHVKRGATMGLRIWGDD